MSPTQQDRDVLEALIDRTSLSSVLDAIGDICCAKAAHLQENWQEKVTSPHVRFWNVLGNRLQTIAGSTERSEQDLGLYRGPT